MIISLIMALSVSAQAQVQPLPLSSNLEFNLSKVRINFAERVALSAKVQRHENGSDEIRVVYQGGEPLGREVTPDPQLPACTLVFKKIPQEFGGRKVLSHHLMGPYDAQMSDGHWRKYTNLFADEDDPELRLIACYGKSVGGLSSKVEPPIPTGEDIISSFGLTSDSVVIWP